MSGIFYNPGARRLVPVFEGTPRPEWAFVTHNLEASAHQCRRILREFLPADVLSNVDFGWCEQRNS